MSLVGSYGCGKHQTGNDEVTEEPNAGRLLSSGATGAGSETK